MRRDVVEADANGTPEVIDLELEWDPCPGDQFQVVRGGQEFAKCVERYPNGSLVPVQVLQWWDQRGYYTWDIYRVGECSRRIEPGAEGSYEKSQECREETMHGARTGFFCSRRPNAQLVAVCPWMSRN